jgi:glycosyltransferase involved in cell wall biosynthesis
LRIAFLNPCGRLGGAETSLREILASLRVAHPDWELWLLLGEDGPLAEVVREAGVRVAVRPLPAALSQLGDSGGAAGVWSLLKAAPPARRYASDLAAWLRELNPDIIQTNGFKMHLLGAWTCPRGVPLIWHIHDYVSSRRLGSLLLRKSRRACAAIIANSQSVASDIRTSLPGVPVTPIYNAVDLTRFTPAGNTLDLDRAAGLAPAPAGTVRVGLVATFARWKGHDVFLEALTLLPAGARVRGYIIGGPIYQTVGSQWSLEELQQKAEQLSLAGKVGFTGFVQDAAAVMRSLDIVVHASTKPEPFGMVIIEAMGCGKPVVVSRAGGAVELFTEGEDALSHGAGDALQLASQIDRLASNDDLRTKLGTNARRTAERWYDSRRLAQQLEELYGRFIPHATAGLGTTAAMSVAPVSDR